MENFSADSNFGPSYYSLQGTATVPGPKDQPTSDNFLGSLLHPAIVNKSLTTEPGFDLRSNTFVDYFGSPTGLQTGAIALSTPTLLYPEIVFNNELSFELSGVSSPPFIGPQSRNFPLIPYPHQSNITFSDFDMSETISEQYDEVQTKQPALPSFPRKCAHPGCEDERLFSTNSALKRHQDKHTRPYICQQHSCANKSFGDKAGLQRHEREVHGSHDDAFTCPIRSCKRNKRGFNRKYNLVEHQKRSHGSQLSASPPRPNHSEGSSEREDFPEPQSETERGLEIPGMTDIQSRDFMEATRKLGTEQELTARLDRLRELRTEIDEDITSLERVLGIMRGGSP